MTVGFKMVREPASEKHYCSSFGALDLSHYMERIEDMVSEGNRYAFFL